MVIGKETKPWGFDYTWFQEIRRTCPHACFERFDRGKMRMWPNSYSLSNE